MTNEKSEETRHEEAGEPKADERQVDQTENVAVEITPQRARSRPAGPREPGPGLGRRVTRRETEDKAQDGYWGR